MKSKPPTLTYPDITWLKHEFLPSLVDEVEKRLKDKLTEISTKLDTFIGDIKDKRQAQELHQGQHDRVDRRLDRVEKKVGLPPLAD